ncbi:MAG: glucoamylase family protein, partial [Candidatus Paceibacterota bacterium]
AIWVQMWDHSAISITLFLTLLTRIFFDYSSVLDLFIVFLLVLPLSAIWLVAPHLGYRLSTTSIHERTGAQSLNEDDEGRLMRYALLHWRFFDEFASKNTHWLIPDNVQEIPSQRIAYRTSPTNIAMQLMAIITAYDFGFITLRSALHRLQKASDSLSKLEKYKGHWYNWYAIDDLRTLPPRYVSTVDSGNLAAAFVAVSQSLQLFAKSPVDLQIEKACRSLVAALRLVLRLVGGTKPPPLAMRRTASSASLRAMLPGEGQLQQCLTSLIEQVESISSLIVTGDFRHDHNLDRRIKTQIGVALDLMKFDDRSNSSVSEGHFWLKWCSTMLDELLTSVSNTHVAPDLGPHCTVLAEQMLEWVRQMDFSFLLHHDTVLLSIGYDADSHRLDKSSYDLFASESRTTSYLAISMNQIPADHWFKLDRSLAPSGTLISWSGTMFEYLMPLLWLENFESTLWDRTYRNIVSIHAKYARRITAYYENNIAVPWGMSESALNRQNTNGDYQYRAFGIPTIALKRGQDSDYVVAPYASLLALMTNPREAVDNLIMIEHIAGALGPYGFRDAIDFTRPDPYSEMAVVRNFMAHHVGMSLSALNNVLNHNIWRTRFHSNPLIASSVLLLHERAPAQLVSISITAASESDELRFNTHGRETEQVIEENDTRTYTTPDTAQPRVALLGTFPYTIMISHCGSGFSTCDGMALYRWRNDSTQDNKGMYIYIRKHGPDHLRQAFSATYHPTCVPALDYRAVFAVDNARFERKDGLLSTWTRVAVSTSHRAEVRLVSIRNLDFSRPVVIDLTSYAEIVLQSPVADRSHKAFGNLFVETEWIPAHRALLARRRPRSARDIEVYGAHVISLSPQTRLCGDVEFETNRLNFIGRGHSLRSPLAQEWDSGPLQGETGAVIDPI